MSACQPKLMRKTPQITRAINQIGILDLKTVVVHCGAVGQITKWSHHLAASFFFPSFSVFLFFQSSSPSSSSFSYFSFLLLYLLLLQQTLFFFSLASFSLFYFPFCAEKMMWVKEHRRSIVPLVVMLSEET